MSLINDLIAEFGDANNIASSRGIEMELDSILDADNLKIHDKCQRIATILYGSGEKLDEIIRLIGSISDELLIKNFEGHFCDSKSRNSSSVPDIESLTSSDMNILGDMANTTYDPSKLLSASPASQLPVALRDKMEFYDIDETEIVIVSRLYKVSLVQGRRMITNRLSDLDNIDPVEVSVIVDEMLWEHATIAEGFSAIDRTGESESKISYMEFFTRQGFSTGDSRVSTIGAMRKQIMSDLDKESRMTEYAFNDFDWVGGKNKDEMEFNGVCIVPKRKVKYDYAINFENQPLQLVNYDKLTPVRQFAPYAVKRASDTLSMVEAEITSHGISTRLEMERYFYTFKTVEAKFLETNSYYNGVKIIFGEWSNELLKIADCDKNIRIYNGESGNASHINIPGGYIPLKLNTACDKAFGAAMCDVHIAYYEFKKIEYIYNDELETLSNKKEHT